VSEFAEDCRLELVRVVRENIRLESELSEARARLNEAHAQNESRGLALLGEQARVRELEGQIIRANGLTCRAGARIAELDAEADRIHADRVRLADKCRELESRNAAEKATVQRVRELAEYTHWSADAVPKSKLRAALAPAPDAKEPPK
jgi:chromosome segregation ATPase